MASLVLGLVRVIQLESWPFISAGWPLWGPVRAFRGQQVASRPGVGWGLVPHSLPAGRRGRYRMKPSQHSRWWWDSEVARVGGLGAGRLPPDTRNSLYERIKSEHCSLGQGTKGSECSFVWRCSPPPTYPPFFFFFFLPLSHCGLRLSPHAWRGGGGGGVGGGGVPW